MALRGLKKTAESYQRLFEEHGYSPKSLGWDKGKQFLRFHQLTSDWDLADASLLDVGCGFGDFNNYLALLDISTCRYTGIDMVPEFIAEGEKRFSSSQANFVEGDFLNFDFTDQFDFAIASGTFNLAIEGVDGYDYIRQNMEKMFELAKVAISIDFISDKVDYQHEHNFNSSPEKILSMAYGFSRNVVLKNTYFPFEFSITLYKDDTFRKETTTFTGIEEDFGWLST